MSARDDFIENILELELDMFLNVPARTPAICQENPDAFRLYRWVQFSVWSEETLQSYLNDLFKAKEQGANLMTLKYARMENLIPPLNGNPIIDRIVQMELEAQREMQSRYPNILAQGRPLEEDGPGATSFKTYLRGELETYSDQTLELLCRDIQQVEGRGQNWAEQLYGSLIQKLGYHSLDELEDTLSKRKARSPAV
jgi:hypothetical protein